MLRVLTVLPRRGGDQERDFAVLGYGFGPWHQVGVTRVLAPPAAVLSGDLRLGRVRRGEAERERGGGEQSLDHRKSPWGFTRRRGRGFCDWRSSSGRGRIVRTRTPSGRPASSCR